MVVMVSFSDRNQKRPLQHTKVWNGARAFVFQWSKSEATASTKLWNVKESKPSMFQWSKSEATASTLITDANTSNWAEFQWSKSEATASTQKIDEILGFPDNSFSDRNQKRPLQLVNLVIYFIDKEFQWSKSEATASTLSNRTWLPQVLRVSVIEIRSDRFNLSCSTALKANSKVSVIEIRSDRFNQEKRPCRPTTPEFQWSKSEATASTGKYVFCS